MKDNKGNKFMFIAFTGQWFEVIFKSNNSEFENFFLISFYFNINYLLFIQNKEKYKFSASLNRKLLFVVAIYGILPIYNNHYLWYFSILSSILKELVRFILGYNAYY